MRVHGQEIPLRGLVDELLHPRRLAPLLHLAWISAQCGRWAAECVQHPESTGAHRKLDRSAARVERFMLGHGSSPEQVAIIRRRMYPRGGGHGAL